MRKPLGDPIHYRRRPRPGPVCIQIGDDLGGIATRQPKPRRRWPMTTRTTRSTRRWCRRGTDHQRDRPECRAPDHVELRSWCRSGNVRMRWPVAAKIAFSTAGPATAIVGSPTPPQNPPDGTIIVSTFGMSAIRSIG
jgi:hypothetical protein